MAGGAAVAHLVFGIIGNIISFLVFLAPITTFRQVYQKKSTGGFSSVPYVVALFSSTLWIFYALVKKNSTLLLSINTFGCVIEAAYVLMYLVYAPKKAKLRTLAYFLLLDVAAFALIVVVTKVFIAGPHQMKFLGSVCLAFSMAVFVAPMSIIFKVIKTKSVEFMPFYLSLFLTMSAVAWFGYGFFSKDPYVMYPNVGGFFFSCVQMGLYFFYRKPKATVLPTTTDSVGNMTQGEVIELQTGHTLTILSAGPITVLDMHKIEPVEQEAPGKEETKEKDMNADKEIIEIIAV